MSELKTSDFYFDLPEELIAQDPLEDRSSSRLLMLDKSTGKTEHHIFKDVIDYLNPGDCLVLNNTKVIPARLLGITADYDVDQTYWAFYVNGEYAMTGVDSTAIEEGVAYSLKIEK